MQKNFSVGLIVHPDWQAGRNIIQGAAAYRAESKEIKMRILPFDGRFVREELAQYSGFMVQHLTPSHFKFLKGRPVVYLDYVFPPKNAHSIIIDNRQLGRFAAEHLGETGVRYFGYVDYHYEESARKSDPEGTSRTQIRFEGFRDRLLENGMVEHKEEVFYHAIWKYNKLVEWLLGLPKPIALFCLNDDAALTIVQACRFLGIEVPEGISVMGADNDDVVCRMSPVPISSIDVNFFELGYEGAKLMDRLLRDLPRDNIRFSIAPNKVCERESTHGVDLNDNVVVDAYSFLRAHLLDEISIDQVANEVGVAPRRLERLFRRELEVSFAQCLIRERIRYAARRLRNSNEQVTHIALEARFQSYLHFFRNFKQQMGTTPSNYR
ncbi:MAG: substrate-binding domain-containing protein, partial [Verrucomicrobiota bacterium]